MKLSDGDPDNVRTPDRFVLRRTALSLATTLETSARIAVVAARDVRRKDRRVCMNRFRSHPILSATRRELNRRKQERVKAIRVKEFGGPEVLRLEEVPMLRPGPGQVLVGMHAIGINPVESYIRAGTYARL